MSDANSIQSIDAGAAPFGVVGTYRDITRLPNPSLDIDDDPDDQPVPIKGEPLSETIIRERR
jgi:hypothetical protein